MFIGHSAVGFASKRRAPATNAGLFLGAAWLLDLLWPIFLLLGIEHVEIGPRGDSPFLTLVRLDHDRPRDGVPQPEAHLRSARPQRQIGSTQ